MKKQWISVILSLMLVIGLLPAFGGAVRAEGYTNSSGIGAEGDTPNRVHWTLYRDGTLYLRKGDQYAYLDKGDDVWAGEILYKKSDNEQPVREPYGKSFVTSLIVEDGIEKIPEHMFESYDLLGNVTLPGLRYIDPYAFYKCEYLCSVTVGGSVVKIGDHAFEKCKFLNTFTVNGTVGSVGESAFRECSFWEFTVPITGDIGASAFAYQPSLDSISPIRGSVGDWAFEGTELTKDRFVYIVSRHSGTLGNAFFFEPKNLKDHSRLVYTGTEEEFAARYVNNSGITPEFQRLIDNVRWDLEDGVLTIHKVVDNNVNTKTIDLLDATEQPWLNIPGRTWDENREQIVRVEVHSGIILGAHTLDGLEDRVIYLSEQGNLPGVGDGSPGAPIVGDSDGHVNSPATGDNSDTGLYIGLMCVSGVALVPLILYGTKRKANIR